MTASTETPVTLDLYVRSLANRGTQDLLEETVARLEDLDSRDVLTGYEIHVWGTGVPTDGRTVETDRVRELRTKIAAFKQWADSQGVTLRSLEEHETVKSEITNEEFTRITLPTMAVAVYHGEQIHWVAPCVEGESVTTVSDVLDALGTRESWILPASREPELPAIHR